jgi:hypothetical protein
LATEVDKGRLVPISSSHSGCARRKDPRR